MIDVGGYHEYIGGCSYQRSEKLNLFSKFKMFTSSRQHLLSKNVVVQLFENDLF